MNTYPKIFEDQPEITPAVIENLEIRGLIIAATTKHCSERRTATITNPTAGDVVGYGILAEKLRDGAVSQQDARVLLVLEATRKKGPRDTHLSRLVISAFAEDRAKVKEKVVTWAKNQK